MNNSQRKREPERLPMIPLRGLVAFPGTITTIDVARERSLNALKRAMDGERRIFLVAQRYSTVDHPAAEDLYTMGTIAQVRQLMPLPDQSARIMVEGLERALLVQVLDEGDLQSADVVGFETESIAATAEDKAVMRTCCLLARRILS